MPKNRILLVDDEEIVRSTVRRALRHEAVEIAEAENGQVALESIRSWEPDVVFLDLRMPVLDGIGLLQELQLTPEVPLQVIILTGHGDDEELRECYQLGARAFLRKPFNRIEIRALMRQSLDFLKSQRQLRLALSLRSEQLEQTEAELFQASKLSLLGEFTAGMVVDLSQPIGLLSLAVESGRKALEQRDWERMERVVNRLGQATQETMDLLDRMRSFGQQNLESPYPLRLNETLQKTLRLLEQPLENAGISVSLDLQTGLPEVQAVSGQLEQVFTHLILNAKEALLLNRAEGERTLHLQTRSTPTAVQALVRDNGGGVPEDMEPHLFDTLYTTRDGTAAAGMGLSISKRLLGLYEADILLNNYPHEGAEFVITFPLKI